MPTDLPLNTVILEIVRHTPAYVWAILLVLIVAGTRQWRDHTLSRARLLLAPIAFGAYSLWGASGAFGLHAEVIGAWLAGVALAFAANLALRGPRDIRLNAAGGFDVGGSPWPLLTMLAVFALRYAVAVTLVFHREWAHHTDFSVAVTLLYGALFGLFAARAVRIWRAGSVTTAFAAA